MKMRNIIFRSLFELFEFELLYINKYEFYDVHNYIIIYAF